MSAMSCVLKWSPTSSFDEVVGACECEGQHTAKTLQGVAFLGLAGLLAIGKAVTDVNKVFLVKHWAAYCESSSITNEISQAGYDSLTRIILTVQPKLHQTALGRIWAQRVIDTTWNPIGLRDQILMVYDYVGMKASQMMYKYLSTAPLVLVIPNVMDDARRFKASYEDLKTSRGESAFPYTRLMGKGEELNHAKFPDLYYCAVNYYKSIGAIGGKDGKFIRSNIETKTEASILDKYCKISAAGDGISEAHLATWTANAAEVGGHVGEEDLKKIRRRLKRKHEESEDE